MVSFPPNQTDADGDRRGRKRRRIALACEECRDRKRKCDGQRPVCGACTRRPGQVCNWDDDRNTKGWSNNYVESLRSRVRELEEALGSNQAQPSYGNGNGQLFSPNHARSCHSCGPTAESSAPQDAARRPSHGNLEIADNPGPGPGPLETRTGPSSHDGQAGESQDEIFGAIGSESCETEVDGMGVISTSLPPRQRPSEYFGPSSTFSLLDEAHEAINQKIYGQEPRSMSIAQAHSQNAGPSARHRASISEYVPFGHFSVPPRAEADALVDSYCNWVHSLYPFVHLPSLYRRYLLLWNSTLPPRNDNSNANTAARPNDDYYDKVGDKLFHCLINVVFALGALFSPNVAPQERYSVSKNFFDRSKKVLDFDLLSCGSVALVQTLLLMGQYLQSTDVPSTCWNSIGLAIRVAQGIGLHLEPRCCHGQLCPNGHDQLEIEMRRRTWTGAVLFDRVLSLTYGRPLMVHPVKSKAHFVLPSAIDDEFLSRDPENPGCQTPGTISMIECYMQAVKLQDILGQVLVSFYNRETEDSEDVRKNDQEASDTASRASRINDSDLQVLLNVDELLSVWHKNLPIYLKAQSRDVGDDKNLSSPPGTKRNKLLKRQATVLRARFLHVRLTLLRPILFTLCDQGQGKANSEESSIQMSMRHDMMVKAANLCISTAQELIELIVGNMDQNSSIEERLPAPWYNVFYIHNSAIVLLMGYLCWPKYITGITEESFIAGCNRCIAFFQAYQLFAPSASRCGKILEAMQRQVFKHRNGSGFDNGQNAADSSTIRRGTQNGSVDFNGTFIPSNFPLASSDVVTPSLFIEDLNLDPMNQEWFDEQSMDMACLYGGPFLQNM